KPLRELVRSGVVDSVGDGIFATDHARDARAAAFWFMAAAPVLMLSGYLTDRSLLAGDARAARVSGGATLAIGAVGTAVIPRSGFPAALPIGWWLLRRARALRA